VFCLLASPIVHAEEEYRDLFDFLRDKPLSETIILSGKRALVVPAYIKEGSGDTSWISFFTYCKYEELADLFRIGFLGTLIEEEFFMLLCGEIDKNPNEESLADSNIVESGLGSHELVKQFGFLPIGGDDIKGGSAGFGKVVIFEEGPELAQFIPLPTNFYSLQGFALRRFVKTAKSSQLDSDSPQSPYWNHRFGLPEEIEENNRGSIHLIRHSALNGFERIRPSEYSNRFPEMRGQFFSRQISGADLIKLFWLPWEFRL